MSFRYIETNAVRQFIGHEAIANPLPVAHHDFDNFVDSDIQNGVQKLHFSIAEPEDPESLIIIPVSWSSYGKRPFHAARMGVMAAHANARVVTLDLPGMGDTLSGRRVEITEKQIEELRTGRMRDLAQGYWRTLVRNQFHTGRRGDLPVVLWGNSFGTLTATEMAAHAPDNIHLSDILLSEPMALRHIKPSLLAANFMINGPKHHSDYYKMNQGFPVKENPLSLLVGQLRYQPGIHAGAVVALARGREYEIMEHAYATGHIDTESSQATRLHVVSASDGLVVQSDCDRLATGIRHHSTKPKAVRRQILWGEGHGYQDSIPCVLAQIEYLTIKD